LEPVTPAKNVMQKNKAVNIISSGKKKKVGGKKEKFGGGSPPELVEGKGGR